VSEDVETGEPEAPATGEKPKINRFRKRFDGVRLSPEAAARQGKAATAAWMALGKEASIEFLNAHNDDLGGRPIDLAVESPEGLAAVEKLLAAKR
jgi:hypothetical protein